MKIALTIWGSRISPVFDSAHNLMIVEIQQMKIINRLYTSFNPELPSGLAEKLIELGVGTLICGAIADTTLGIIERMSIKVLPFVTGKAHNVAENYAQDFPIIPEFLMPGCGVRNRSRNKGKDRI